MIEFLTSDAFIIYWFSSVAFVCGFFEFAEVKRIGKQRRVLYIVSSFISMPLIIGGLCGGKFNEADEKYRGNK